MSDSERPKTESKSFTYAASGVDIDTESDSVKALISTLAGKKNAVRQPGTPGALVDHAGGFSGLIEFGDNYLALCTDGVGSKLLLAAAMNSYSTVGIDCIAMNVNDLICIGAEPMAFVDYIAAPSPDTETWKQLGQGLNTGCQLGRVSLCGGETASLPGMLNHIDMNGTALGYVKKGNEINGDSLAEGDVIIGLPSSGVHSNGYSLVRSILDEFNVRLSAPPPFEYATAERPTVSKQTSSPSSSSDSTQVSIGDVLMNPTTIYVDPITDLLKSCYERNEPCNYSQIHGIFHITGGGLSNLLRLNKEFGFEIDSPLNVLPEFQWLQDLGDVSDYEMFRTFNMGMGMCVIVDPSVSDVVSRWLSDRMAGCKAVGRVTGEKGCVRHIPSGVVYDRY